MSKDNTVERVVIAENCPNCDNSGCIPVQAAEDEWEPQQCEFCYVVPYSVFNIDRAIHEYEHRNDSVEIVESDLPF